LVTNILPIPVNLPHTFQPLSRVRSRRCGLSKCHSGEDHLIMLPSIITDLLNSKLLWMFVAIGFAAQLCDGALGMGFGVISSSVLTALGYPRAIVSAAVNGAKILTCTVLGLSHVVFHNIDWRAFGILTAGGIVGGLVGALAISSGAARIISPIVSFYLILVGIYIIWGASHIERLRVSTLGIAGVGLAGGALEAVAGVWGPIVTSNLVAIGLNPRLAVGSGILAEVIVAAVVFSILVSRLGFDQLSRPVAGLILGAMIASPLAAKLTTKIPKRRLMVGVGVLVIVTSLYRLARDLGWFH
jgi:uncharacterized membrane protein YfcA